MVDKNNFLLPPGFRDLLPDDAEREYYCANSLINSFYSKGYRLVATPLVEFEESLFEGAGQALEERTLKLIDPQSQKLLGLRADITTQVSRVIRSRLDKADLPLKLCYTGDIIRSYALNTRGQRQLKQAGVELVDSRANPASDAEVAILALESLKKLGLKNLTIDINTPNLISTLGLKIDEDVKKSIEKRDIAKLPKEVAELIKASGSAEKAFKAKLDLPKAAQEQVNYCRDVYERIKKTASDVNITADFAEDRGFEYHTTFSFSIFAKDIRDELGRGGRYEIGDMSATGFTVYINAFAEKIPFIPGKISG